MSELETGMVIQQRLDRIEERLDGMARQVYNENVGSKKTVEALEKLINHLVSESSGQVSKG